MASLRFLAYKTWAGERLVPRSGVFLYVSRAMAIRSVFRVPEGPVLLAMSRFIDLTAVYARRLL